MFIARAARGLVLGSAVVVCLPPVSAEEPPPCRAYLVPCNIGDHYTGTVHWVVDLESSQGKTTEDVTVRVVRGKTTCEGSVVSTDPSAQTGAIRGAGLLIVEWGKGVDDDPAMPWYRVAASCPGVGDSSPAQMNGGEMDTYKQPRRRGFAALEGTREEENPDADAINGVTGMVRLRWSLSRE